MSSERVSVSGLSTAGLQGFGVQGLRVPLGPWFTKTLNRKTRTRAGWKWIGTGMR